MSQSHSPCFVPYARGAAMALLLVLVGGCATGRYVGAVSRDGTYANRGFGVALNIRRPGLDRRWLLLDPSRLPNIRLADLPVPSQEPIDIDGDGLLSVAESVLHYDPTLRLRSRTSTGAFTDVRVEIMSGQARNVGLDQLLHRAIKIWAKTPRDARIRALARAETTNVGGRPALVATATTARWAHHIAVIDHGLVKAEARIRRRQLVTVHMYAPQPSPSSLGPDFEAVLDALILNRATGRETDFERW